MWQRSRVLPSACTALLALLTAGIGCGEQQVQFNVQFPNGPPPSPTISVLGVFKDGRMNARSWEKIGPQLTASFKSGPCEVFYGDRLVRSESKVADEIDRQTREEGMTADLLRQIAPRSMAKYVLLVDIHGNLPTRSEPEPDNTPQMSAMRGGGMRGRGTMGPMEPHSMRKKAEALEMTALIISTDTLETVGRIGLRYTGESLDEALSKFAQRVQLELPNASCGQWKWNAPAPPPEIPAYRGSESPASSSSSSPAPAPQWPPPAPP